MLNPVRFRSPSLVLVCVFVCVCVSRKLFDESFCIVVDCCGKRGSYAALSVRKIGRGEEERKRREFGRRGGREFMGSAGQA